MSSSSLILLFGLSIVLLKNSSITKKKTLNFNKVTDEMPSCINHKFIQKHLKAFEQQKSGTVIIWSDLDKISKLRASDRPSNFYTDYDNARLHFKLTYHKYLLEKDVNIFFGGGEDINTINKKGFDQANKLLGQIKTGLENQ